MQQFIWLECKTLYALYLELGKLIGDFTPSGDLILSIHSFKIFEIGNAYIAIVLVNVRQDGYTLA